MMNKKKAMQIAKLWNDELRGSYEPTMTEAQVVNDGGKYSVHIMPIGENEGRTFHHTEQLTDVCRTFGVNGYVSIYTDENEKKYIIARIF